MTRSPHLWLVLVGPLLVLVALGCVARVGRGELLLVVRRRRVQRRRTSGLAVRWPVLEHFESVPTGPQVVPIVVRARTRDDVDIAVLAEVTVQVDDVAVGTERGAHRHPARVVEEALAEVVGGVGWASVVAALEEVERDWPAAAPALPAVTRTRGLVVSSVEARLTRSLP